MSRIELSPGEMMLAAIVGILRQAFNRRPNAHGVDNGRENPWGLHVMGALGELVLAKDLNVYWNPHIGDYDADDVGPYQVRATAKDHYRLRLHPNDKDDKKFVLITGTGPTFTVVGWCYGREGKKTEYWEDPTHTGRPAFWVPHDQLRPMHTLKSG
jgi:hypothetical protein